MLRTIAENFVVNLHAIEQMQLRSHHRGDGVGRLKFDIHTGAHMPGRCKRITRRDV